jgi:polo-like kinase 1
MKTKHATLFRLSNKIVQVNFEDSSQIVMSSHNKKVSYLSKKGQRTNYLLSSALDSGNSEMIKRLNYARQVLEHTINKQ